MQHSLAVFLIFMSLPALITNISGYVIYARRKQPLHGSLARYIVVFGTLLRTQNVLSLYLIGYSVPKLQRFFSPLHMLSKTYAQILFCQPCGEYRLHARGIYRALLFLYRSIRCFRACLFFSYYLIDKNFSIVGNIAG